jgi:phospholipid transport system substrate-binding protein
MEICRRSTLSIRLLLGWILRVLCRYPPRRKESVMPYGISRLPAVCVFVLLALFGVAGVAAAAPASDAEMFVQASIDRGYQILNNKALSTTDRQVQFREFLNSITDTKRVALFTLGTYARNVSKDDIDRFLTTYDEFAAAMYQGYFDWYTGQSLRVVNSAARAADDVVVYADVIGPNGAPQFKVGFRVRKGEGGKNIVTDFQFEGVWLALNQRSDFTSFLQQNKGNFALLTTELEKRTQRFREAWAPPKRDAAQ